MNKFLLFAQLIIMSRSDIHMEIALTIKMLTGSFSQEREIVYQDNITIAISPYLHNVGV